MKLNSSDTVIDRLSVQADTAARADAAASELRRAAWPSYPDKSWIFIRSVRIRSAKSQVAHDAAEEARRLANKAVDGRLPAADAADAVRFDSLSQMLAWLLADIVSGRAHTRWFWQSWKRLLRLSYSGAITQLVSEYAEHFPSIVERLDEMDALTGVWQRLSPEGASRLLMELSRATHTRLVTNPRVSSKAASETTQVSRAVAEITQAPIWPATVRRWRGALSGVQDRDPRRRLACALIALRSFPLQLSRHPEGCLRTIALVLLARTPAAQTPGLAEMFREQLPEVPPSPRIADEVCETNRAILLASESKLAQLAIGQAVGAYDPAAGGEAGQPLARDGNATAFETETPAVAEPRHASENVLHLDGSNPLAQPVHRPTPGTPARYGHTFFTRQGGLFYLINALNHPAAQAMLADGEAWTELPSGWAWLFRVGQSLGLEIDDPVVSFLAGEMGYEAADLNALPAPPVTAGLLSLLARQYARDEVWNSHLLNVAGLVVHTASHLDVEFPMSAVRLPVRMAGLDINPGWVPWLGRVVTFHYLSAPGWQSEALGGETA